MRHARKFFLGSILVSLAAAAPGQAADGYFLIGYSARQKALGGANVADARDAMAISVNPAGIVGLARQFQLGMTGIVLDRGYETRGLPRVLAPGSVWSERPFFPVPNGGYVAPIDADSGWSVAAYANGGINTAYSFSNFKPPLGGPLGGGFAGVDLQQAFTSVGYARRFGSIMVGVAPTIALQMINVQGLKGFAPFSSNMWELSDSAYDWSFGGGLRVGVEWRATETLRLGFSGATPMFMTPFGKYSGLFADYGRFDIPATLQAGVAYDVLPTLTVLADWRHVFYSAVPALGNPTAPITAGSLGSPTGPGFDWTDVDSAAFGAEWRATPALTLRGGYHYSSNPLRARSVTVNVLSPVVNRHHLTGGVNYLFTKNSSVDFTAVYAFKNSVTGYETFPQSRGYPFGGVNPLATVSPWLRALEFTLGYNYKFDAGDASLIPTHF